MPETSFVAGWPVGVLLVIVVVLVLIVALGLATGNGGSGWHHHDPDWDPEDDPGSYDWEHDEAHPGFCQAIKHVDGMTYQCDMQPGHQTDHFDTVAKFAWRRLGWK